MKERLQPLLDRYQALEPRERRILAWGAVFVAATLLYLAVWQPLMALHTRSQERLDQARATAERLELLAAQAASMRSGRQPAPVIGSDQSLLSVVDQAGKNSSLGKPLSRIQPDGEDTVRVWLEDVPFDALLRWIEELKTRYAIAVTAAEIEGESPGVVDARLSLERAR